jgi:hypothetical protein
VLSTPIEVFSHTLYLKGRPNGNPKGKLTLPSAPSPPPSTADEIHTDAALCILYKRYIFLTAKVISMSHAVASQTAAYVPPEEAVPALESIKYEHQHSTSQNKL